MAALKKLVDRADTSREGEDLLYTNSLPSLSEGTKHRPLPKAPGGTECLRHLLLRLDFADPHHRYAEAI